MEPDQAANELTEEQVLYFLVNTLDEEIDIELGESSGDGARGASRRLREQAPDDRFER